jgi:flagellar hook-length control protein FliK
VKEQPLKLLSKVEGELKVELGNKEQLAQAIHPAETLKQEGSSNQVQTQSMRVPRIPQAINQVNLYGGTVEQAKAQTQVRTVSENLISIDPSTAQDKQQQFNELESLSGKAEKDGILSEDNDSRLMALGVTQSVAKVDAPIPSKADSPVWVQVAQEIQQNVPTARTPLRELDIQLHPAELGHIRIALTWDNGQVHLRMAASEAGTGQTLQATLPDLRQSLTGMGIQCGMMQMGFGDHRQNPQQGQQRESMTRLKDERNNEISSTLLPLELETPLQGKYSGSSSDNYRINVTA